MSFEQTFIGRPNTVRSQLSLYKTNLAHLLSTPITEILARRLISTWQGKLSAGTQVILLIILQRMAAYQGTIIDLSHLQRLVRRSGAKPKKIVWTKEQYKVAIDVARHLNSDLYDAIVIVSNTGMRHPSETSQFSICDNKVFIKANKYSPDRLVPISTSLKNVLSKRQGISLFPNVDNRMLARLCKCAEVPQVTWSSLRTYFATRGLETGQSPRTMARLLGHASPATTLKHYWADSNESVEVDWI